MKHIVTCRTEDCFNNDISIELEQPGELIICGVCGNKITDIVPPIPIGGYPVEGM